MGKPEAIEYKLHKWDISFWESGNGSGSAYQARIIWTASYGNMHEDKKIENEEFSSFDKAKAWIDKEIKQ